jgi:surface antigen
MRNTMKSMVLMILTAVHGSAAAECQQKEGLGGGEVVGTLLGAAVGGLLGAQVGKGNGNKVAIGLGVLGGGLLGKHLGSSLDCADQGYHTQNANTALETAPTGTSSAWVNPDNGHQGSFTPVRTYQKPDGTPCREFSQTIVIDGRQEQGRGTACRQPDGTWRVVEG